MSVTVSTLHAEDGAVLYVGVSGGMATRLDAHRSRRGWWCEVASARFEHFDSRVGALAREAVLIRDLDPPHNRMHPARLPVDEMGPGAAEVHRLFEASGLTQEAFAQRIGACTKSVYRWLAGEEPAPRSLMRLREHNGNGDPDLPAAA